jgi:hypothetical protein
MHAMSTAEDLRSPPVIKIEGCSKARSGIAGDADVRAAQSDTP